jgi:hypothetical protein
VEECAKKTTREGILLTTYIMFFFVFVFPRKKAGMALATLSGLERNQKGE